MDTAPSRWHFLINPAAGRGKARHRWLQLLPQLQAALPGMTWAESTTRTGLAALAEAAVRNGLFRLVGVGGDGTHHHIVNGIIAAKGLGRVIYAPLPLGSGNDWVRTLKTPRRLEDWLTMLAREKTMAHGVGVLEYGEREMLTEKKPLPRPLSLRGFSVRLFEPTPRSEGEGRHGRRDSHYCTRYFLNVAGMAYDAVVLRRAEQSPVKHRFLYPLFTLLFLRDFTAPTVRISYDGQEWEGPVHTINLGIGRYSGGGMQLVPQAEPRAKTLALTFAERLPLWRIIAESWRFYAGSIGKVKGVTLTTTTSVHITALKDRLELEADGEWLGYGSVEARLLEKKLCVIIT